MGWLSHRHPVIPFRGRDSHLLTPNEERHWKQKDCKAECGRNDSYVLDPHARGPRCEREEDDDGEEVPDKDDANHDVA